MKFQMNLLHTLAMLKSKAIRMRIWYEVLSIHDRVLISLTLRYIRQVNNMQLAIVLSRLIIRLRLIVDMNARAVFYGYSKAYTWIKSMICMGWSIYSFIRDNIIIEWFSNMNINRKSVILTNRCIK